MTHQTAHFRTKTEHLPTINRDLLKARHIQAHIKELAADGLAPSLGIHVGPYRAPLTRWIE